MSAEIIGNGHLPEVVPQISFDRRLGENFTYVDFDYDSYTNYLRERGLDDQQIDDTTIRFLYAGQGSRQLLSLLGGSYSNYTSEIKVTLGHRYYHNKFDRFVVHETEHHIDNLKNRTNKLERVLTKVSNISMLSSLGLLGTYYADKMVEIADKNSGLIFNANPALNLSIGSFAVFGFTYGLNPLERRARKAAKKNSASIVTAMYR